MTALILEVLAVTVLPAVAFTHVIAHYGRKPALHVPVEFESDWRQPADRNVVVYDRSHR